MKEQANGRIPQPLRGKLSESDIVQDSLIKVAPNLSDFTGESEEQYRAWLGRILSSQIKEIERRYLATKRRNARREVDIDQATDLPDSDLTASSMVRRRESDQALMRAIERLSPKHQELLELRHKHQMSWDAIAAQLGTTGEAARKAWSRALRKLEAELDSDGRGELR